MKTTIITMTVAATFILTVLTVTFVENMPNWCADPSGSGNWIIMPLCN